MKVKFYCPYWGSENMSYESFCKKAKESGYDGVELPLPEGDQIRAEILQTIKKYDLEYIAQHWETADVDPIKHAKNFEVRLRKLASTNPILINSQTGKDFFEFEDVKMLVEVARKVSEETGIKIIHETHRGKFTFAPHITKGYLIKLPDMRLGLDLSHWCTVSEESFLENHQDSVAIALERADHIHARVGYCEGPQIPDPRVPEWQESVNAHLGWWDKVVDMHRQKGAEYFTITPEFGPYPYMVRLPYTEQPITNQWDVNVYMKDLLNKRYNNI